MPSSWCMIYQQNSLGGGGFRSNLWLSSGKQRWIEMNDIPKKMHILINLAAMQGDTVSKPKRLLVSGLGGGLDVVNASILYFAAKHDGHPVELGSVRPTAVERISDHNKFSDSGTRINGNSRVASGGRYIEPRVSQIISKDIFYFGRQFGTSKQFDASRLRTAILTARSQFGFSDIVFVDGGGDSLVLQSSDVNAGSETSDPFQGGDAELLTAVHGIPNVYMGVISVGLDINPEAFHKNLDLLTKLNGYYGRVNIATGEKSKDFRLDHLFSFQKGFLDEYFSLAKEVLVLDASQLSVEGKLPSHTATVTYHALKGSYGMHRTFVPWEPVNADGTKGVMVDPSHCWMYFFDATKVEDLKRQLNGRKSAV